jgi:hypothetical protein
MSTSGYRALIAGLNLLLVGLITFIGFRTFVGTEVPSKLAPPADFDPVQFEIVASGKQASSIGQHQVVWSQLDPAPPPPPQQPSGQARPQVNRPQDLSSIYQLLAVGKDTFIVQKRGGPQETYGMGDVMEGGYTIESISFMGQGDSRVAVVTVKTRGGSSTIRLSREPQR